MKYEYKSYDDDYERMKWNPEEGGYIYNKYVYLTPSMYATIMILLCTAALLLSVLIGAKPSMVIVSGCLYCIAAVMTMKMQSDIRYFADNELDEICDIWINVIIDLLKSNWGEYQYLENYIFTDRDKEENDHLTRLHKVSMIIMYPIVKKTYKFYLIYIIFTSVLYDKWLFETCVHCAFDEIRDEREKGMTNQ